ncbi:hypothetical protein M5D96_005747 [Drosophila gunungcola]|uniref:Bicaudal D-related protein homolog n=1 Tax=Drosophila gunungcola TaxID=103775 RepID=A0A9Q0BR30_9MUSC|nr:hypothetical protein M5D96_005747 [Drosophila gunungcola]
MHKPKLANAITAAAIASSISTNNKSGSSSSSSNSSSSSGSSIGNKSKRARQFGQHNSSLGAGGLGLGLGLGLLRPDDSGFDHLDHDHSSLIGDSIDLEHYISAMEARRHDQEPDVWAQLQQKESDILLAAELGKALLEKNEELVKQQEKLIEDYSTKIEVSHQHKSCNTQSAKKVNRWDSH